MVVTQHNRNGAITQSPILASLSHAEWTRVVNGGGESYEKKAKMNRPNPTGDHHQEQQLLNTSILVPKLFHTNTAYL